MPLPEALHGLDGGVERVGVGVVPLQVVQCPDAAGRVDHVAAEGPAETVDLGQVHDGATGMTRRSEHLKRQITPVERFTVCECACDREAGDRPVAEARAVVDVKELLDLPERLCRLPQLPLIGRNCELDAGGCEQLVAAALVTVMVGVKRPLQLHPLLLQGAEDEAATDVDRERVVAASDDVDVAAVTATVDPRSDALECAGFPRTWVRGRLHRH